METEIGRSASKALLDYDDKLPLVVATGEAQAAVVIEIRPGENDQDDLTIILEPFTTLVEAARSRSPEEPKPKRLVDLRPFIAGGRCLLTVPFPNGERARIVNSTEWLTGTGFYEEKWLVLVPSAAAPSA